MYTTKKLSAMPYAQAEVHVHDDGTIVLISYTTPVAYIEPDGTLYIRGLYSAATRKHIGKFVREVRNGKVDAFMLRLKALMADTPYELIRDLEVHYQNVMFIFTKLMGLYVQAEYRTSRGRIDLTIGTDKYVYIIELKLDGSAEEALAQINEKDYALPFAVDGREIVKIGANITSETRNLERWVMES